MDNFQINRSTAKSMAILRGQLKENDQKSLDKKWQSLENKVAETESEWDQYKDLRTKRQKANDALTSAEQQAASNYQKTSVILMTQPIDAVAMTELHNERKQIDENLRVAWKNKNKIDLEMKVLVGPLMGKDKEMELFDASLWDRVKKADEELLEAIERLKPSNESTAY